MLIGIIIAKLVRSYVALYVCMCACVCALVQLCAWLSYNSISLVVQPVLSQDSPTWSQESARMDLHYSSGKRSTRKHRMCSLTQDNRSKQL